MCMESKEDVMDYKREINRMLDSIKDEWILRCIYKFVLGMGKDEKHGLQTENNRDD